MKDGKLLLKNPAKVKFYDASYDTCYKQNFTRCLTMAVLKQINLVKSPSLEKMYNVY